jgi:hypothetical protein
MGRMAHAALVSPNVSHTRASHSGRYFPLKPGTAFHYKGFKGRVPQIDDMVVTHQTIRILGVTCTRLSAPGSGVAA